MGDELALFTLEERIRLDKVLKGDQIVSISGTSRHLLIGTDKGRIIQILIDEPFKPLASVDLNWKHPVYQLEVFSAINQVLAICGQVLFEIDLETLTVLSQKSNIFRFALNSDPVVDNPFVLQLVMATSAQQLHVCEKRQNKLEIMQKINTNGFANEISYSKYDICFSCNGNYYVHNLRRKTTIPLFPFDVKSVHPHICKIDVNEFLLAGMDGLAIFIDGTGVSPRPPILMHSLKSFDYHDSFVHFLTKDGIAIVGLDDMKRKQVIPLKDTNLIKFIDGLMIIIAGSAVFVIKPVDLEIQIDKLMSDEKFTQALEFQRTQVEKAYNPESILTLHQLEQKIGFKYLEKRKYEDAAELLIASETNPSVIKEQLFKDGLEDDSKTELQHFLDEYLLTVRKMDFCDPYTKITDNALFHLYLELDRFIELTDLDGLNLDYNECAQYLLAQKHFHYAARLALEYGQKDVAVDLWKKLFNSLLHDKNFNSQDVLLVCAKMESGEQQKELLKHLVREFPEDVTKILINKKYTDAMVGRAILRDLPHLLLRFFESLPITPDLPTDLCKSYIKMIIKGEEVHRQKLRKMILMVPPGLVGVVKTEMGGQMSLFTLENLLLESRVNPEKSLKTLLEQHKDYDSAELLCDHYSTSHPDLSTTLLLAYLKLDIADVRVNGRIRHFLDSVGSRVNAEEVITNLPSSMSLAEVSKFLQKSVARKTEVENVETTRFTMLDIRLEEDIREPDNRPIRLGEDAECAVCHKSLSYAQPLTLLSTGFVIHGRCLKYPHLCPVTNAALGPV